MIVNNKPIYAVKEAKHFVVEGSYGLFVSVFEYHSGVMLKGLYEKSFS